jgi:hypothetical protein
MQAILTPDYSNEELLVDYEPYWRSNVKPRNFKDFSDMYSASENGPAGLWEVVQVDARSNNAKKRIWSNRSLLDQGALNVLQSAISNAVPASVFNNIYINNNDGSTTLTVASGAGAISTGANLTVASLPAAIPLNYPSPAGSVVTQLLLGYGGATTQVISMNAACTQGATALNIVGFTPSINFPIGTAVVPIPNVAENPSNANLKANQSTVVEMYSGNLSAGAFVGSATTGAGNRSVTTTFLFKVAANGGSTPVGSYSSCWLTNVSTGAGANSYIDHLVNAMLRCDASNNISAAVQIKM